MNAVSTEAYLTLASVAVSRWNGSAERAHLDDVAEEVPVALEYNGISHAVMLASPADLDDFALGFSFSEGIIRRRDELYDCEVIAEPDGIRVALQIASERFAALKDKRRNLTGRTGCGLCGAESLQHAIRTPPAVLSSASFSPDLLQAGFQQMERMQGLQHRTGATHAAAWLDRRGDVTLVREDVGRHNALDKLVGAMTCARADFATGAVLITSRASYEMVQKAATLSIGMLAAVSAPTGLAIRLAESTGMTLAGFVRRQGHVVYAHPQRLTQS